MFEKLFKGATALLTGYMIVCFTRDFLHYHEKLSNRILRFVITMVGIMIPMTASNIPDFRNRLRIGFFFIIIQFFFLGKVVYTAAKKKDKRLIHFVICLTPFLLSFISQIIARVFFKQRIDTLLLAISWIAVIFLFLAILIIHFVQLANEVENMNKNLEQLVAQRTDALEKEKNRALKEIDLAGFVQKSFYKLDTSGLKDWKLEITSKPMAGVSGDLYMAFISDNHLDGIGIFDISGHGIASGLVTMLVKNIIEQEFYKGIKKPLNEVMAKINDRIILEKGNIENYLTGMLIRFNKHNIELVNAGHPKAILYNSENGTITTVEEEGVNQYGAIGIADFPISFETLHFNMNKNDELVLYTDGITECTNENKKYFGTDGILAVFKSNIGLDVKDQVTALPAALRKFSGSDNFNDDITYMILKKLS
jgi:sigma-B regulation protein RsbU (phosphoserine phosphatase)